MATSIADFKQAFAGKASDNGLQERDKQTRAALLRLKAAIDKSGGGNGATDGFQAALTKLVKRYDAVRKQAESRPADAGVELDEIHRQTQLVTERIEGAPPVTPLPGVAVGAESDPGSRKRWSETVRAYVPVTYTVVDDGTEQPMKGVRVSGPVGAFETDTAGLVYMQMPASRTHKCIISASTYKDVFDEFDLELLPVKRYIRLERSWVRLVITVLDAKTGKPVKDARLGNLRADAEGRLEHSVTPNTNYPVTITAHGYATFKHSFTIPDRDTDRTVQLTPIAAADVEQVVVGVTVRDRTGGAQTTPIPNAKVEIGRRSLTTDADGFVNFSLLPGTHSYTVTAQGFIETTGQFDVYQSKEQEFQSIYMFVGGTADLRIRVATDDRGGNWIAGASVRIASFQQYSDKHGEARFSKLPFGDHKLKISAEGYEPLEENLFFNPKFEEQSGRRDPGFRDYRLKKLKAR